MGEKTEGHIKAQMGDICMLIITDLQICAEWLSSFCSTGTVNINHFFSHLYHNTSEHSKIFPIIFFIQSFINYKYSSIHNRKYERECFMSVFSPSKILSVTFGAILDSTEPLAELCQFAAEPPAAVRHLSSCVTKISLLCVHFTVSLAWY